MKNKFLFLLLGLFILSFASAYSPLLSPSEIKSGNVVATRVVAKDYSNDVLLASKSGKVIRLEAKSIPEMGRSTIGVRLIKLDSGDHLVGAAFMDAPEELVDILNATEDSE